MNFDENKFRTLFAAQKKKRFHYDYYSNNNDNESADEETEDSGIEESDKDEEIIVKKKKNIKNKNITKIKLPPLKKQQKTKTKRHHRLHKQLIVFKYFIDQIIFVFVVLIIVKQN